MESWTSLGKGTNCSAAKWTQPTRPKIGLNRVKLGFLNRYIIGLNPNLNPIWGQHDPTRPVFDPGGQYDPTQPNLWVQKGSSQKNGSGLAAIVQRLLNYPVLLRESIASWSLALVFSTFTPVQVNNFEIVPFFQLPIKHFDNFFLFKFFGKI